MKKAWMPDQVGHDPREWCRSGGGKYLSGGFWGAKIFRIVKSIDEL